jgi:ubiquinone/menaquinone biosynthesis C-methylase UbiE
LHNLLIFCEIQQKGASTLNKSENNSGLRSFLKLSSVYDFVQKSLSKKNLWKEVLDVLFPGTKQQLRVLDIGCGTGNFLLSNPLGIPEKIYTGIDPSSQYIETAKSRFPEATFLLGTASDIDIPPESFDLVVFAGVLHHLNDSEAEEAITFALEKVSDQGAVVSIDPVFFKGQNPIAKFIAKLDRGQHVRSPNEMKSIWERALPSGSPELSIEIKTGYLRVPYNHIVCVWRSSANKL